MKSYNKGTIELFNRSILEDEYSDSEQNDAIFDGQISEVNVLNGLINYHLGVRKDELTVLNVGAGGSHVLPGYPSRVFRLEPNAQRQAAGGDDHVVHGWAENIETTEQFDLIVCWGTLCYVRSLPETLIQFNQRLIAGGKLVLETVTDTVMPLAQTTNPDCFVRYASLFGFELECRVPFGLPTHKKEGFRFKKVRDFDYHYLMIPQAKAGVHNYLFERDWYLR